MYMYGVYTELTMCHAYNIVTIVTIPSLAVTIVDNHCVFNDKVMK